MTKDRYGNDDDDFPMEKRKSRQNNWLERQERSRMNQQSVVEQKEKLELLRKELAVDNTSGVTESQYKHFNQLPISDRTQLGLERANYKKMTPIQCDALPLALSGHDVLGAAKTGSGKTLCFVLPVIERLYLEHWSSEDGVGALVLSPTRELALQIFKVLQVVGYKHVLSAALLTGGRDIHEEKKRLQHINIIIGTPGRVLHHLSGDTQVNTDNLQILVMDEADRLLDMGFRESVTAILETLPKQRQTLLFSATQTTDVQMLAQMSLNNPRYVATHAMSIAPTPSTLCQNFLVVELHRKLDVLMMFLKRHPNDKIVVFVSTCNQVKFMYLAFSKILKKMRIPSMCLTGKMKQFRREEVFLTFCRCKGAVLFCTDIAARGLDFPLVHWVVQYDCPDSAQTYIHRAGRTARGGARGVNLLMVTPSETPMLSYLANKRIPLREIKVKSQYMSESKEIFVALVVQGLKYEAQKAFIAYLRSLYFASNKHVFQVASVDVEKFAHSLGLMVVPDMSELQKFQRGAKNLPWDVVNYIASRSRSTSKSTAKARARGELDNGQMDDGASSSESDDDNLNDGVADAAKMSQTRREKHLAATDLFRMMEQRQKYAPKNLSSGGGDDDDDDFLVKKVKPAPSASNLKAGDVETDENSRQLTFDERMAGLSKNKIRKYVQTADLRVRDLGLTRVKVLDNDREEEEGSVDAVREIRAPVFVPDRISDRSADKHGKGKASKVTNSDGSDESSDDEHVDYASTLRRRLEKEKEGDTLRSKNLRRGRLLKREGRLEKGQSGVFETSETLGNRGKSLGKGSKNDMDEYDDDENEYASDVSDSSSLNDLLRAARGELYSDSNHSEEEEEVARVKPKKKTKRVAEKKKVNDDGDDNSELQPRRKKQRK